MDKCNGIECECEFESNPIVITDNMGREIFWEDLGRPDGQ
jgi:hypothetical protein